jgi:hypothetical protein
MAQSGFTPIQLYNSSTPAATPSASNLADGEVALNVTDGKLFYKDNLGAVQVLATKAGADGDVVGPGSATDNALARFDTTTGKLIQNSVAVLDDSGNLTGLTSVASTGFTGALTGNASTATTLQTARTINGTSFNGSADITTANWGTARTLTIGATGKSVNGSAGVTWTVDEIGATAKTSNTGSSVIPAGTQLQRDGSPAAGYFRFNTTVAKFEGYNGTAWGAVGGGATGGGSDEVFVENGQTVTTSYAIPSGKNAMSTGPILIDSGAVVTIPDGSRWVVL